MEQVRLALDGDREEWNRVAQTGINGTLFHTWEWSETIRRGQKEEVYRVLYEHEGNIVALWPCFTRSKGIKASPNLKILWSPYPSTWGYGGPCVLERTEEDVVSEMLNFISELIRKDKRIFDFRVSMWSKDYLDFFRDWTEKPQPGGEVRPWY